MKVAKPGVWDALLTEHNPKTLILERVVAELDAECTSCAKITRQVYIGVQEIPNIGQYKEFAGVYYQCPPPCNSSHLYLVPKTNGGKA